MKIKFKNGSIIKKGPSLQKKIKKTQVIRTLLSTMDTDKSKQPEQPTQGSNGTAEGGGGGGGGRRADELQDEFINTGRIGRRNALHDILDSHCETSTADLPMKLSALTTNDSASSSSSSSSSNCQTNETSSNQTNNK